MDRHVCALKNTTGNIQIWRHNATTTEKCIIPLYYIDFSYKLNLIFHQSEAPENPGLTMKADILHCLHTLEDIRVLAVHSSLNTCIISKLSKYGMFSVCYLAG